MAAHSGETAQETGDFRCARCHEQMHVTRGHAIPTCPNCGNDTVDARLHESGRQSS